MGKKVALHNLGCKVNAYEVEAMQQLLEEAGYEIVPFEPGADVYLINTCTVTNIADRKSRQMLHKAKKMNPDAIVIAAGCYVQTDEGKLDKDEAVDLILGNNQKGNIVQVLEEYEQQHTKQKHVLKINQTKEYEELAIDHTAEHVRAYIKVQDGCNQFCTYCIIPYARGRVRSRKIAHVMDEVNCFFEVDEEKLLGQLREHMSRQFLYLNVAANESLFLFQERYADYETVAKELYQFFKNKYDEECYLAVSEEITDWQELPEVFSGLEEVLAEKFYQPRQKIFFAGEVQETREMDEAEESQVLNNIKEDIQYKDSIHLRQDFQKLERKYRESMKFSEMYVKFVFSNIVKDIYEEINPGDVKALSKMIDRLYRCRKIEDVLAITEQVVCELEKFVQEQNKGFRNEVMKVKQYIHHHYAENLNVENLARQVYLSPGYLSVVFKEETGVNLNRYVRDIRMKKSRELLENTSMKISQIAKEVGFSNNSYFCRSFREYFGSTPESCRKGSMSDEEASLSVS